MLHSVTAFAVLCHRIWMPKVRGCGGKKQWHKVYAKGSAGMRFLWRPATLAMRGYALKRWRCLQETLAGALALRPSCISVRQTWTAHGGNGQVHVWCLCRLLHDWWVGGTSAKIFGSTNSAHASKHRLFNIWASWIFHWLLRSGCTKNTTINVKTPQNDYVRTIWFGWFDWFA